MGAKARSALSISIVVVVAFGVITLFTTPVWAPVHPQECLSLDQGSKARAECCVEMMNACVRSCPKGNASCQSFCWAELDKCMRM